MSARTGNMLSQGCLIGSVAALGYALQIHDGFYDERALAWLTAALALCIAGVATLKSPQRAWRNEDLWLRLLAAAAIGLQVFLLLRFPPGMYLQPRANLNWFHAGVAAQAALVAVGITGIKPAARLWFPAILVTHFALGIWMLHASPSPHIDVVVVHRDAIDALARGQSPYAINFENIYGADSGFYNPQAVEGGRVMFGYPYPPLSLLVAAPGQWLAGDYRYAELFAWVLAAALIGFGEASVLPKLAATLLLTTPRGFFVLEQGWTEPVALLMLALTVFAMARLPGVAAWAGGLLLVTKQYLAVAGPLLWRFAAGRGDTTRFLFRALILAAAVTLPFALLNLRAFVESVLLLQTREPFRADSLSYLSWAARQGFGAGTFAWAAVAAVLGVTFSMIATPNTPAGFAASLAFSSFLTFAFGSKAFCNYYFFVVGAICCAIASRRESTTA